MDVTHLATLLPDGRVLVVGGSSVDFDDGRVALPKAEVWDPATSAFSPADSLPMDDYYGFATALADGRVLIISDEDPYGYAYPASAEVWDPVTDTFSPAGSHALSEPISVATLLPDGRVLVVGGEDPTSAEVWDPVTAAFSPAGSLALGRGAHSATALPDGRVLVVGGWGDDILLASAEIWEPSGG
jgi:WD40 repeat protein